MAMDINLETGKRAERKLLITIAAWGTPSSGSTEPNREVLGTRIEESAIELNPDVQTSKDIRGINYTDVNKTEPQQTLDPFSIIGGSALAKKLTEDVLKNNIQGYTNCFNIYVITAFISETSTGSTVKYFAVKHENCSIIPQSIGGSDWVDMPIEVHYSNKITSGSVDKLDEDFTFTADT